MAARYTVGDKVRLTRKVSVDHFTYAGMSIKGEIVKIRDDDGPRVRGHKENWNYGIKFSDRSGVWWYAGWEFKRIK